MCLIGVYHDLDENTEGTKASNSYIMKTTVKYRMMDEGLDTTQACSQ